MIKLKNIKPTDLMVGNLLVDGKGRICKVEQVSKYEEDCMIYAIEGATTSYPLFGIPLYEKMLLRLGFRYIRKKEGTKGIYANGELKLILSHSGIVYLKKNRPVHYVHDCQNLFHAITITEITLKDN